MSVELRPMRGDEFATWLPLMRERYAEDVVRDYGMSAEKATAKAVADIERLLPRGSLPAEHSIFVLESDGRPIGDLWLAERDGFQRSLFVFDLTVDEPFRRCGHGRAAMALAEAEARRRGLSRVVLWVGGRNEAARHLYGSLGYEENAIGMSKAVAADAVDGAVGKRVVLRPMRDDEFAGWLPRMRDGYARAMSEEGGVPPADAAERAAAEIEHLFPGARPSAEQLVFMVEADGEPAGDLWLCERDDTPQPCLFVYDIRVDEAYRGRGCGRAAMLFAEDEARRRGRDRVTLNVFGRNAVARSLYLSLGYAENGIAMSKKLG